MDRLLCPNPVRSITAWTKDFPANSFPHFTAQSIDLIAASLELAPFVENQVAEALFQSALTVSTAVGEPVNVIRIESGRSLAAGESLGIRLIHHSLILVDEDLIDPGGHRL